MNKKIAAALLSASLVGGGAVGALLGTPSLTSAQESTTEDTTEAPPQSFGPRFHHRLGAGLEAAADALGLSVEELRTALADGGSIADVAAEQNVDVQTVIDAMVAEATTAIDEKVAAGDLDADRAEEMKANLVERVTAMVNGERPAFGRGGPGHHGRRHHFGGLGLEAAAEALGITEDELRDELRDGSSIADVAAERNVDVQTVIDAMVEAANERLDEVRENLPERITAFVNGERPPMEEGADA